jgi:hypothetical protein
VLGFEKGRVPPIDLAAPFTSVDGAVYFREGDSNEVRAGLYSPFLYRAEAKCAGGFRRDRIATGTSADAG